MELHREISSLSLQTFRGAGAPWPKNKDFHYKGEMCA